MTSRRPMPRTYSSNGRSSSFSGEEEGSLPNGRTEGRNTSTYLSNVRPENRSTLCTVMAQLTEDIQPSFDSTLKSKAVSENCNVKFTCVVSGYPAPDLKWYKDDMEMDRYCGLPKYEIRRNGKTHSLHIYNCTLDDAAIYQASANNSKGIVSCSGVLEVGTMSEYKIHQRFFAKLKEKAENKKRDLEESKKKGDDHVQKEQRKRAIPAQQQEEVPAAPEPNGLGAGAEEAVAVAPVTSKDNDDDKTYKETLAKKKIKIANGVEAGLSSSKSSSSTNKIHMMGNGGENSYDGGIGLAHFLAEAIHSKTPDERNTLSRAEKPKEMETSEEKKAFSDVEKPLEKDTFQEKKTLLHVEKPAEMYASVVDTSSREEREQERNSKEMDATEGELAGMHKGGEQEMEIERENNNERLLSEASQSNTADVKRDGKPHKDHHIQASISSVLHSVKDFFFGKTKKDLHDHKKYEEKEVDQPFSPAQLQILQPETPPRPEHKLELPNYVTQQDVPLEPCQAQEISNATVTEQQVSPLTPQEQVARILYRDYTPTPQKLQESTGQGAEDATEAAEPMDVSAEVDRPDPVSKAVATPGAPAVKEVAQDSQDIPIIQVVPVLEPMPTILMVAPGPDPKATAEDAMSPSLPSSLISLNENMTESLIEKEVHINNLSVGLETQVNQYPSPVQKEENDEVKSKVQPCPNINSTAFDEWGIASLKETCDSKLPMQVPVILIMDENTTAPDSVSSDNIEAEMDDGQRAQEGMNAECSATVSPERLELGGLKIQKMYTPVEVESIHNHDHNTENNSTSALEGNNEGSALKEGFASAFENDLDVDSLKIPDQALSKVESSVGNSDSSQENDLQNITMGREFETEKDRLTQGKAEDLGESETRREGDIADRREGRTKVTHQEVREKELVGPAIPEIKVFAPAVADIPDIKVTAPEVRVNDQIIIIPQIEIITEPESEVTKSLPTQPPDPELLLSQRNDALQGPSVTKQNMDIFPLTEVIQPTQKSLPNDGNNLSQIEKVQGIEQVDLKIDMHNGDRPNTQPSVQVSPEMDYSMVPIINISCTDDSNIWDINAPINPPVLDTPQIDEVPPMPLFVVPPISITCNDSPPMPLFVVPPISITCTDSPPGVKRLTHVEYTQTQEPGGMLPAHELDTNTTTESDERHMKDKHREITESITENSPAVGTTVQTVATPDVSTPVKTTKTAVVNDIGMDKTESRTCHDAPTEELHRDKPPVDRLGFKPPTPPSLSPASVRRFLFKTAPASDSLTGDNNTGEEFSGGSTPTSSLSCESSPRLKRRDSLSVIRSATPEELASGARRKIFVPKSKSEEGEPGVATQGVGAPQDPQAKKEAPSYMSPGQARRAAALLLASAGGTLESQSLKEAPYMSPSQARRAASLQAPAGTLETQAPYMSPSQARRAAASLQAPTGTASETQGIKEAPYMSPSQARRAALLQAPSNTPPMERRSPLLSRRKATLEVPKVVEEAPKEEPEEKQKLDPFKAPQVIRKIRGEPFPDASGHLKLWCQFFNVLSDCTIKWYRDEEEILEVKRSGGDESQVALAIVQASSLDCGVYGCTITNEYGTDTTDFLLSVDIMSEILLKDDLEVGEEIEMIPMLFAKGLADTGSWGDRFFGRIMTEVTQIGEGCAHKASKVKVIYGLDPIFESGSTCIIKIKSPIAYGTTGGDSLAERNQEITKQECKVQNMIREYCKIFAAEARVIENFGFGLEVIPKYLMYRPANSVPYATVESELDDVFLKYCLMDAKGRLVTRTTSEVEQKCSTFQHWLHQWTHGNLLVTQLEGVGGKLTNIRVATKSKGYQGLTEEGSPKVLEQFLAHHQCNYYCGLLSLRPLKTMDSLQQPSKVKGSRSPMLNRKLGTGSGSPLLQRKGTSPQISRKAGSSPKVARKAQQQTEDNKSDTKPTSDNNTLGVVQIG